MVKRFAILIERHQDEIVRALVERIYSDKRTHLAENLSFEQLVDPIPELLDEIARVLDGAGSDEEIFEAARQLRSLPQIRFRQGVLIDEVAWELIGFRKEFNGFLVRESRNASDGCAWDLLEALWRSDAFIDEMLCQAVVVHASSLRPPVETRTLIWPPPRRRRSDLP
jgi:hypothetical protein